MVGPNKYVLVVENCTNRLDLIKENVNTTGKPKEYRMSGIFTEFNIPNRNERIYTADKFLPHLNELMERKNTLGVVYGEWDHPDVFDTSLSRVSHTIEKVFYNAEKNRVDGEIRLLNTHWGKEAKALVEDGCPIFVSSRAAGVTESDGTVTVKKLFTYDAVADPGFGSAKMEIKSLNESLGFNRETNFRIYDVSDESKINELFSMNNEFVTKVQMTEYSDYLKSEIENVKNQLNENVKGGMADPAEITKLSEIYDNLQQQQNKVAEYLDYLAEKVQIVVNENKSLKDTTTKLTKHNDYLAEELEKSIKYSEYLAEKLDKNIDYAEYIAENLDKNIDFSEYIAEHVDKNIEFSDYLAEHVEKSINYSEYLAENLDKNIDYSEYIAENLDKNIAYSEYIAENLDKNIDYSEYLAENLDKNIEYAEYIAENLDNNIAYAEYIAEHVDNNIEYAEYIAEHVDNNIAYSEYIAENMSDTQAYMNYIAEGLDNTMETIKSNKLFEQEGQPQAQFDMRNIDPKKYYEEDDDFAQNDDDDDDDDDDEVQEPQGQVQEPQTQEPSQMEEPMAQEPMAQEPMAQPAAQMPVEPIQAQPMPGMPQPAMPASVEGEPVGTVDFVPGATIAIEDRTGEILATNPTNNILVVKMADNQEVMEVHESRVRVIGDSILETEDSLKAYMTKLITETKKRKASEQTEPEFVQFLTEKNKKSWYGLSAEDKEKVICAVNESGDVIYTERQVLYAIQNALTEKRSFTDILMENMPAGLKPIWDSINEEYKKSILSAANLYPNLDSPIKMENFWESRNLESYVSLNESKKVLNQNNVVDNTALTDEQINKFIQKIKNI